MKNNGKNKNIGIIGALSAFYLALSYLSGIVIFLIVLKYQGITNPLDKLVILNVNRFTIFLTNILMYILFGPVFILFILSLKYKFENTKCILLDFSTIIGYIWAGSLVASGMVANAGIESVLAVYKTDVEQAKFLWQTIDFISIGLGNGNGEILGGLFSLFICISAIKNEKLTKFINILGIITGIIGTISVIPMFKDLGGIFGVAQIIWFIATGIFLLPRKNKSI